MTKEELIKHLHEALDFVNIHFPYRYVFVEAIEALSQHSIPSNLDEAAKDSWTEYEYRESPKGLYSTCYVDGFKAGAEWMAGRGITFEGKATRKYERGWGGFFSWILFDQQKAANLLVEQGKEVDVIINIRIKDKEDESK